MLLETRASAQKPRRTRNLELQHSIVRNRENRKTGSLERESELEWCSTSEGSSWRPTIQDRSETSEGSILGTRDPNSQPDRGLLYPQDKEEATIQSIETEDIVEEPALEAQITSIQARNASLFDWAISIDIDSSQSRNMSDRYQPTTDSVLSEVRPRTLLSPVSGQSLREQVGHRRTISAANASAHRANYEASQPYGSRSPSIIPEPIPPVNSVSVGNSRLEPQTIDIAIQPHPTHLSLHTPLKPSRLSLQSQAPQVQVITELDQPRLEKNEYIVSLPLPSRVQDQYSRTVRYYQKSIQNTLQAEIPEKSSMLDTAKLLTRLENISTHIDLDNDTALSQTDVPLEDEANWAVSCSAKFQFLQSFLASLRHCHVHVSIVVRKGQLLEVLERFLSVQNVTVRRVDTSKVGDLDNTKSPLYVTLVASGKDWRARTPDFASMVIAFDSTFDSQEKQVRALRTHPLELNRRLSPVVHLVIYSSADHIERCLPEMKSAMDKHKTIINCIVQTKSRVGVLQPEEPKPDAAAEEVAAFVEAGCKENAWTLPKIQVVKLQGLELMTASQSSTHTAHYGLAGEISPIMHQGDISVRMLPNSLEQSCLTSLGRYI